MSAHPLQISPSSVQMWDPENASVTKFRNIKASYIKGRISCLNLT